MLTSPLFIQCVEVMSVIKDYKQQQKHTYIHGVLKLSLIVCCLCLIDILLGCQYQMRTIIEREIEVGLHILYWAI